MMLNTIDTRHGTANQHSYSNGNTLPYTGVPFASNYFCVQTNGDNGSWWFHPEDRVFQGFRLTHQPSPWMGDFSHLVIAPISGNVTKTESYFNQSSYRPEEAVFQPHYLKTYTERHRIINELTGFTYGGHFKFTYERKNETPGFFIRSVGPSSFKKEGNLITGYISNFAGSEDKDLKMYIALSISEEVTSWQISENDEMKTLSEDTVKLTDPALYLTFETENKIKEVEMVLATSFISPEQAMLNLSREVNKTFKEHKEEAADKWLNYLNRIEVEDKNQNHVNLFYQMMYRSFLFPQTWHEINENNEKVHYDTLSKTVKSGPYYTNNGFWDTCRTIYPLYSLIATDEYEEMLEGFYNAYQNSGYLPKWLSPDERGLMPGTLIDAVIADAAVKGIASEKMPAFLEAMVKAATTHSGKDNYGRQGTEDYLKYGYVPSHYHESVNHTQDYAYSDFCISRVADILNDTPTKEEYEKQSLNYRNLVDTEFGVLRAKDAVGTPKTPFNPYAWGRDYAEGSAYQNSFAAFHDYQGLIKAHGGKEKFTEIITELCNTYPIFDVDGYGFEIHEMSEMAAIDFGQIAISNQPSFHLPHLFNYVGQLSTTQHILKELMTRAFELGFRGYPGDEDNGSMSAWFIFNSLGMYPVTPGSGEYSIGVPLFDKVTVHLANGKDLTIHGNNNVPQYHYSKEIRVNGEKHSQLFFKHADLMKGAEVEFDLCLVPPVVEYREEELPYSLTK
ncbi:GH92 family glycosyl hydrolase [Vagococcus hydrophili]|nr:GH92 family glycosyl hydrolase [Vagococcus hydrophili]